MLFLQKPRYYDTPEGTAPIDKVVACSKKTLVGALGLGIYDAVYLTDTKNALETVNCLAYWVVPMVGMAATWASVTYMSTKIRGKDDYVNYVLGAAACIPIIHAWKKTLNYTLNGGAILMFSAVIAKHKADNGWEAFPDAKHNFGIYQADFSLTKNYDKDFRSQYKYQT